MIEKYLLSRIVKIKEDLHICLNSGVEAKHFQAPEASQLFQIVVDFYHQYSVLPTIENLQYVVNNTPTRGPLLQTLLLEIYTINSMDPIDFLIKALFDGYKERTIRNTLLNVVDDVKKGNIDQVLDRVGRDVSNLKAIGLKDVSCLDLRTDIDERRQRSITPETSGVFTGFQTIDFATGGLHPGELWVVCGYLKNGKTTFLLNVAYNAWRMGKNVLFVSVEQARKSIIRRWDSLMTGIPTSKFKRGELTPEELALYSQKLGEQKNGPLFYVFDAPGCTTSMIKNKVQEIKNTTKLDLICADYIGIIEPEEKGRSEYEGLGNVALELREIGRLEYTAVLTAHQLKSESVKAKRLGGQHVAGSVGIPRHADGSIGLKIDDEEEKNLTPWCKIRGQLFATRDCPSVDFQLEAAFSIMTMREPLVMR